MRHSEVLTQLINDKQYQVIAELGVYTGHLTKHLLKSCPCITSYFAIDSWKPLLIKAGRMGKHSEADWYAMYLRVCSLSQWFNQLKVVKASSLEAAKLFSRHITQGFFDLVYIDTTHFYLDTLNEIKAWLPLVKPGGILAGHDYGTGQRKGHQVDLAVDEFFGKKLVSLFEDGVWAKIK